MALGSCWLHWSRQGTTVRFSNVVAVRKPAFYHLARAHSQQNSEIPVCTTGFFSSSHVRCIASPREQPQAVDPLIHSRLLSPFFLSRPRTNYITSPTRLFPALWKRSLSCLSVNAFLQVSILVSVNYELRENFLIRITSRSGNYELRDNFLIRITSRSGKEMSIFDVYSSISGFPSCFGAQMIKPSPSSRIFSFHVQPLHPLRTEHPHPREACLSQILSRDSLVLPGATVFKHFNLTQASTILQVFPPLLSAQLSPFNISINKESLNIRSVETPPSPGRVGRRRHNVRSQHSHSRVMSAFRRRRAFRPRNLRREFLYPEYLILRCCK